MSHGVGMRYYRWDMHSCPRPSTHLHMPMYSVSLRVLPTSTSRLLGLIIFILVTCRGELECRMGVITKVSVGSVDLDRLAAAWIVPNNSMQKQK